MRRPVCSLIKFDFIHRGKAEQLPKILRLMEQVKMRSGKN